MAESIFYFEVHFAGGEIWKRSEFMDTVGELLIKGLDPIKFFFPFIKKTLIYDRDALGLLHTGESEQTLEQVCDDLECDDVMRNLVDIECPSGHADPGALWQRIGDECFLFDKDQLVFCLYDPLLFESVT